MKLYNENLKGVTVSSNTSLLHIRQLNYPPISRLVVRNENGPVDKSLCYDFISKYISNVLTFFGEDWKAELIFEMAETIYADYYYLTMADWKLLAQRIKSSYYGKVYGKFTPSVLMNWVGQYAAEWTQVSIDISLSSHNAHKQLTDNRDNRDKDAELVSIRTMYHKLLNN